MHKNSELEVFKNLTFFGEISNNCLNYLFETKAYRSFLKFVEIYCYQDLNELILLE